MSSARRLLELLSPAQLSTRLGACKTFRDFAELVKNYTYQFNALHDSIVCVNCGRFGSSDGRGNNRSEAISIYLSSLRRWLNRRSGSGPQDRSARSCGNIIHAWAKLRIDPSLPLFRELCGLAKEMVKEFNAHDVSNCLWSMASLGVKSSSDVISLVPFLIDQSIEVARELEAQGVSICFWSVATLGVNITGDSVVPVLIRHIIKKIAELNTQHVSNCIWSVAKIGKKITGTEVIPLLVSRCIEKAREFNHQGISNCLWSLATLQVRNKVVTSLLYEACIHRTDHFNPQEVSNCIWAVAKLGDEFDNAAIIPPLLVACLIHGKHFNGPAVSMTLWALDTLQISDRAVIQEITRVFIAQIKELDPPFIVQGLWAFASLSGDRDDDISVAQALMKACFDCHGKFHEHEIVACLWSLSSLSQYSSDEHFQCLSSVLVSLIDERYSLITGVDEARQCLQAHYLGLTLSKKAVNTFHTVLRQHPDPIKSTISQSAVAAGLKRLGYSLEQEVSLYDGMVTVDIVIELSDDGVEPKYKGGRSSSVSLSPSRNLAVEFDGPWHYMRPANGSIDRVGPTDARTRMRNKLIRRSRIFDALLVIPFYEWDDARKRTGPDGGYGEINGVEATAQTLGMAYLKGKIDGLLNEEVADTSKKVDRGSLELEKCGSRGRAVNDVNFLDHSSQNEKEEGEC